MYKFYLVFYLIKEDVRRMNHHHPHPPLLYKYGIPHFCTHADIKHEKSVNVFSVHVLCDGVCACYQTKYSLRLPQWCCSG